MDDKRNITLSRSQRSQECDELNLRSGVRVVNHKSIGGSPRVPLAIPITITVPVITVNSNGYEYKPV